MPEDPNVEIIITAELKSGGASAKWSKSVKGPHDVDSKIDTDRLTKEALDFLFPHLVGKWETEEHLGV